MFAFLKKQQVCHTYLKQSVRISGVQALRALSSPCSIFKQLLENLLYVLNVFTHLFLILEESCYIIAIVCGKLCQ